MQNDDVSSSSNSGMDVNELIAVCPSFSTYYSDRQAAAARAVNDASQQPRSDLDEDEFGFATGRLEKSVDEDGEFEFSILRNDSFPEGEFRFPIFDRDLVGEAASVSLKKLFIDEEREANVEWESESEDELESVEAGTYCVWKPKTSSPPRLSPGRSCKKSKSTGSCSKRWKLRDLLLRRSNSDGKESFVYLTPSSNSNSNSNVKSGNRRGSGEHSSSSSSNNKSAHEMFYVEKRAVKEEDRKRSYLPYRKGLVGFGFFPNSMGVTNNFRPF